MMVTNVRAAVKVQKAYRRYRVIKNFKFMKERILMEIGREMDARIDVKKINSGNDNGSELESNSGGSTKAPLYTPSSASSRFSQQHSKGSFCSSKGTATPMQSKGRRLLDRKLTKDCFSKGRENWLV